ncbi:hypothetical protein Mapa_016702 [Marchantia paleacea]|nr:hypothetical protein Mapa_016702 [Marchantia paleacea]
MVSSPSAQVDLSSTISLVMSRLTPNFVGSSSGLSKSARNANEWGSTIAAAATGRFSTLFRKFIPLLLKTLPLIPALLAPDLLLTCEVHVSSPQVEASGGSSARASEALNPGLLTSAIAIALSLVPSLRPSLTLKFTSKIFLVLQYTKLMEELRLQRALVEGIQAQEFPTAEVSRRASAPLVPRGCLGSSVVGLPLRRSIIDDVREMGENLEECWAEKRKKSERQRSLASGPCFLSVS